MREDSNTYIVFLGAQIVARDNLATVVARGKDLVDSMEAEVEPLLIFNEQTGQQVDLDFRGSVEEVLAKALPPQKARGVGRPKLGVTSREISLLPRHWEWLETQAKSSSATLRLLVEQAMKQEQRSSEAQIKQGIAVTDRIMYVVAGNLPQFEEASRALNARDLPRLEECMASWPADLRAYVLERAQDILALKG